MTSIRSQSPRPRVTAGSPGLQAPRERERCERCDTDVPAIDRAFGGRHGPMVENADTALSVIDQALGVGPPRLELIWTQGAAKGGAVGKSGVGVGAPGHLLIRYRLSDGRDCVMNISGDLLFRMDAFRRRDKSMVSFFDAKDYFFDTHNWWNGAGQGGLYNSGMVSVRIEQGSKLVRQEQVEALHQAYVALQQAFKRGDATFALVSARFLNALRIVTPLEASFGNCAIHTSQPLRDVGVIRRSSMWPKRALVQLLEQGLKVDPLHTNVVRWERIGHAKQTFGENGDLRGIVSPHSLFRNVKYRRDMKAHWDAIAFVPEGRRELDCVPTFRGRMRRAARTPILPDGE